MVRFSEMQQFPDFLEFFSGNFRTKGAFHSTKNSRISGPKLNGTVRIPGNVFEHLGIRFECTLFDEISEIETFGFHSQGMSGLVSLPSVSSRGHSNYGGQSSDISLSLQRQCSNLFPLTSLNELPVGIRLVCIFIFLVTDTFPWSSGSGFRTPPTNTLE